MRTMPRVAAIYRIRNRITGEVYIGCTIDVYQRIKAHVRGLDRGSHENTRLREAWVQYGRRGFAFGILETIPSADLLEPREQHWLDQAVAGGQGVYNAKLECRWAIQPKQRGLIDWSTYRPVSRTKRLERDERRHTGAGGGR
jgi:group I intron endonuclease